MQWFRLLINVVIGISAVIAIGASQPYVGLIASEPLRLFVAFVGGLLIGSLIVQASPLD